MIPPTCLPSTRQNKLVLHLNSCVVFYREEVFDGELTALLFDGVAWSDGRVDPRGLEVLADDADVEPQLVQHIRFYVPDVTSVFLFRAGENRK